MVEAKKQLRLMLKEYRNQINDAQWKRMEYNIQNYTLKLIHTLDLNSIGCYIQSQKSREVSTHLILKSVLKSGIKTCVPIVTGDYSMDMIRIDNETSYQTNKWGIPEPVGAQEDAFFVPAGIIVPMLGADTKGYRIGYGKGYYDRYLSTNDSIKIGICPQACVVEELPIDQFDIPMDYLITENGILRKNAK